MSRNPPTLSPGGHSHPQDGNVVVTSNVNEEPGVEHKNLLVISDLQGRSCNLWMGAMVTMARQRHAGSESFV